ncbi:hypothetical protein ABPG72_012600 [Tetrahymena utriculariae]
MLFENLHQFFLKKKLKFSRKAVVYSLFLIYPITYVFWCYKMNELWFKNNLRFLHPEIFHPSLKRYDEILNKRNNPLVAEEIQELNSFDPSNRVDTVLNNLKLGGQPLYS